PYAHLCHHHSFPTRRSSDLATRQYAAATNGSEPTFSPDGRTVAYAMYEGNTPVIKLLDRASGAIVKRIVLSSSATELKFSPDGTDRKSTRLNSSHRTISYAV